ncbi:hypothetical protein ABPG74_012163 [Tetrahymena malaccensis]
MIRNLLRQIIFEILVLHIGYIEIQIIQECQNDFSFRQEQEIKLIWKGLRCVEKERNSLFGLKVVSYLFFFFLKFISNDFIFFRGYQLICLQFVSIRQLIFQIIKVTIQFFVPINLASKQIHHKFFSLDQYKLIHVLEVVLPGLYSCYLFSIQIFALQKNFIQIPFFIILLLFDSYNYHDIHLYMKFQFPSCYLLDLL